MKIPNTKNILLQANTSHPTKVKQDTNEEVAGQPRAELNGNVAELWTAKNGKLQSLTIYFDTLTFANNTKP